MKTFLAQLQVPGYGNIDAPASVPTLKTNSFGSIYSWALGIFIVIGIITALGFIIIGGFKWITSGGDKQKLEAARKTLMFAIIGLILMFLSLVIVKFIGDIFGVRYF